ncbi:hypothetical protein [Paenibacillus sp. CGMCC 1.18879]|uniref:hypothetical protein n=1 Tax=Paenibacillus sp. CGMCC 1.18879 TaxID=2834466 RepID=UPI001CA8FC48|nr:hypothetical protein [Paenibacillus sp. CGMCC 1.18879]MBY9077527.1 hypothetical protein [Paenibacillus sp. CGMCC 1.18879]
MTKSKILLIILLMGLFGLIYHEATHVYGAAKSYSTILPDTEKKINAGIDNVLVKTIKHKNVVNIEGWAYINGVKADQQKAFFVLASHDKQYILQAEKVSRGDLPAALNDSSDGVENSGVKALINASNIADGSYQLGFYIENGSDKAYSLVGYSLIKAEGKLECKENVNQKVDFQLNNTATQEINANVESVSKEGETYKLKGWGFLEGKPSKDSQVYVVLKQKDSNTVLFFDTQYQIRKDVVAYYKDNDVEYSGFKAIISEEELKGKQYSIGVFIVNGSSTGIYWSKESIGE